MHTLVETLSGYKINIRGQEGISVIRYGDRDEYKLHCDGPCGESDVNKKLKTGLIYSKEIKSIKKLN